MAFCRPHEKLLKVGNLICVIFGLKPEWRNIYGALPRFVIFKSYSQDIHQLINEIYYTNFLINNKTIILNKNLPNNFTHVGMLLKIYYEDNTFKLAAIEEIKVKQNSPKIVIPTAEPIKSIRDVISELELPVEPKD